jgi:hypothetical protein
MHEALPDADSEANESVPTTGSHPPPAADTSSSPTAKPYPKAIKAAAAATGGTSSTVGNSATAVTTFWITWGNHEKHHTHQSRAPIPIPTRPQPNVQQKDHRTCYSGLAAGLRALNCFSESNSDHAITLTLAHRNWLTHIFSEIYKHPQPHFSKSIHPPQRMGELNLLLKYL